MKIFYSWQSDLPNKFNRGFIEDCIKRTIKKYKDIITIDADRDVQNNTGSPDIANTIFAKIDDCDLFIADISIINKSKCKVFRGKARPTPNPNVLLELGYAAATLGWDRIVCIFNTDYSDLNALPFDLRQHRITDYSLIGKEKSAVRSGVVDAISATIDGLIAGGSAVRPKGTHAFHQILGVDLKNNTAAQSVSVSKVDFSKLRKELVDMGCNLVDNLNASSIRFTGNQEPMFFNMHINLDAATIKEIASEEKTEVTSAAKQLLGVELFPSIFCFGDLKERRNYLGGGFEYEGTDAEKQKYQDYLMLKRLLTEIVILDLFCKQFEGLSILPLAIKNISTNLDRNINITVTVEGDNVELVSPTKGLINGELQGNVGFVCDFGFILNAFGMEETPEIKFDEIELYDYYDDNPYINLWDGGTTFDIDDCVNVLSDYIATPIATNVVEFNIASLQANETKWLSKVILLRAGSDDIKLKYSIKSDNTDGNISGIIS